MKIPALFTNMVPNGAVNKNKNKQTWSMDVYPALVSSKNIWTFGQNHIETLPLTENYGTMGDKAVLAVC